MSQNQNDLAITAEAQYFDYSTANNPLLQMQDCIPISERWRSPSAIQITTVPVMFHRGPDQAVLQRLPFAQAY
jgi:hypothetical protein